MLEVCFRCPSIVNHKFIFESDIVTKEMFRHQQDTVYLKRPEILVPGDWILLCDFARINKSPLEQWEVTKHETAVLWHAPSL
jgi:hypothetical protein